jgi:hypothetical protein
MNCSHRRHMLGVLRVGELWLIEYCVLCQKSGHTGSSRCYTQSSRRGVPQLMAAIVEFGRVAILKLVAGPSDVRA